LIDPWGRRIIPDALRGAGEDVRVHDDLFPQDAKDEIWLAEAGRHGWIVLTKDKNIRYRAVELQALIAADVRAFVLTARGNLTGSEVGQIYVKALPAMKSFAPRQGRLLSRALAGTEALHLSAGNATGHKSGN
jgi:predicted nuclease of predicted toxin-antitoxin system